MKVAEQDSSLGYSQNKDKADKKQETKHVINLMWPGIQEDYMCF